MDTPPPIIRVHLLVVKKIIQILTKRQKHITSALACIRTRPCLLLLDAVNKALSPDKVMNVPLLCLYVV